MKQIKEQVEVTGKHITIYYGQETELEKVLYWIRTSGNHAFIVPSHVFNNISKGHSVDMYFSDETNTEMVTIWYK